MTNTVVGNRSNPASLSSKNIFQKKQNRLGPYILLQTLGEGEFGKVKLGVHVDNGQEVAIKLIKKEGDGSDNRLDKVEREISVLKLLHHPYIVKLYNVVETEKYIGIILEYASGGELFEYILAHRFLKEKDAKKFFAQLISSVQYMHERNIVHRDLKLENLLLDKNRNIVVTDFGFANQFDAEADDLMATTCGSPCYAAPELVVSSGLYAGSAVDIWSCGVILYAMLCGFLPFDDDPANPDSDNINQLYKYIMSTNLMFPSHVSEEARELLLKMIVPDPTKRCSLEYIVGHPWLKEYRVFLKANVSGNVLDNIAKQTPKSMNKEEKKIIMTNSVSTTVSRQQAKTGGLDGSSRIEHIPTMSRDRFAPVTNEKFLGPKQHEHSEDQRKSSSINFAITQPSATTTENPVHVTSASIRASKTPNVISRNPVKHGTTSSNDDKNISPEKSLSSPVSVNDSRTINLSAIGNMYKNQQRGADKLLSFFTGVKASNIPTENEKEINVQVNTLGQREESVQESANEPESNAVYNGSSVYHENQYVVHSVSDTSTVGMSVPSLCLSEDISSPTSPGTPSPKVLLQVVDGKMNNTESLNRASTEQSEHDAFTFDNVPLQVRDSEINACTDSISSGHGMDSLQSSIVSFKDAPRHAPVAHCAKEESHPSVIRQHYNQTMQSDNNVSIESTPTHQEDRPPQPEVSSSTRLTSAVGDSGRKAIAAVRKSIYRKSRNQPEVVEDAPRKREPLISFSKSRFEETGKQIQNKRNQQPSGNQRHTWGASPATTSISEAPGKSKDKVVNVPPKKTGNKMMDWIKKKSQGKENKKEPVIMQRTNRINPPTMRLSASKKTSKPKNEKETPEIKKTTKTPQHAAHENKKVISPKPLTVIEDEVIEIPEHNNIHTRKRANSGSSTALKDLAKREKQLSKGHMQIHQGAIDRSALTEKAPAVVLKDVIRILRILGIETKLESEFVLKCHRRKAKSFMSSKKQDEESSYEISASSQQLEPIYGDASIDNGDEIRFAVEICRIKNLPGLYIVDIRRIKGNAWAYKFLYHKLIDFLEFDKNHDNHPVSFLK